MAPRRIVALLVTILLTLATLVGAPATSSAAPTPAAPAEACAAERAAVAADNARIAEHNSRRSPTGEAPPEVARPYNAEAQALNAQGDADVEKLRQCTSAVIDKRLSILEELGAEETSTAPPTTTLTPDRRARMSLALTKARASSWTPAQRAAGGRWKVAPEIRELYDVIRGMTPGNRIALRGAILQGRPKPRVGDRNYALPDGTFQAKPGSAQADVQIDHIISVVEIMNMPGFLQLTPENVALLVNAPLNLQWSWTTVNRRKGSGSIAALVGLDPGWQAGQVVLEDRVRATLRRLVQEMLAVQEP